MLLNIQYYYIISSLIIHIAKFMWISLNFTGLISCSINPCIVKIHLQNRETSWIRSYWSLCEKVCMNPFQLWHMNEYDTSYFSSDRYWHCPLTCMLVDTNVSLSAHGYINVERFYIRCLESIGLYPNGVPQYSKNRNKGLSL